MASQNDLFCGACGQELSDRVECATVTEQELKVNDVRFNLGVVYVRMGKYGEAIKTFEKILQDDPSNSKALEMCQRAREMQAAPGSRG